MIKVMLKNGYFFKGEILEETDSKLILRDIKDHIVEILKSEIIVREVME